MKSASPATYAGALARLYDESLAFEAESVAVMLQAIEREQKGGLRRPLVVVGVSAGTLAVPALIERHGKPDAVVLVCGSATMGELIFTTALRQAAPRLSGADSRPLTRSAQLAFAREVRQQMQLEPEDLAGVLRDVPVLLLAAGNGRIVPSRYQRELAALLPHAEVEEKFGGHTLRVFSLPRVWPQVEKWLARVAKP